MKKIFYGSVVILFGFLFLAIGGCETARVDNQLHKTGAFESKQQVEVYQLAKSSKSWDGSLLSAYPKGQPEVTILRIVIPAGVTLDMHKHPVINAGVLLKGELTVHTEEGKTLHLKAGEPIVEVVNTWHYGKNEGVVPAEIIVFYAGTEGAPITVQESDRRSKN